MGKKLDESQKELRSFRRQKKASVNCFQEILVELMSERNVQIADIHKATGIPFPTLQDWVTHSSRTQLLNGNILALSRYFNVSINYLAFGIGEDEKLCDFGVENA